MLWPPPRTDISRPRSRAKASAADHVRGVGAAHDRRRPAIDHRVPDGAHGVVGGIAGKDDSALHGELECVRVEHAGGDVHESHL